MKNYFYLFIAAFLTLIGINESRATHVSAAEITYTYSGTPNSWILSLRVYRDCSPGTATLGQTVSICYSSASLSYSSTITLFLTAGSGQALPPSPCLAPGSPNQCYEEYIYQGLVTLPGPAPDWRFTWDLCCRNGAITNLVNPLGQSMTVFTTLNSVLAPDNSSPVFSFIPIQKFCMNSQFFWAQGAVDQDGDSLVYILDQPEGNGGGCPPPVATALTYTGSFTPTNPLTTASGTTIDPATGLITFTPSAIQFAVICVRIFEYRNGNLIGTVKRDMQIQVVQACSNIIPAFTGLEPLPNGLTGILANCGDSTFILKLTDNVQCASIVPTDIRVTEPSGFLVPVVNAVPVNCQNSLTDSIQITLYSSLKAGLSYLYTKVGNDGNTFLGECGTQFPQFDSIPIFTVDNTVWSPVSVAIPECEINSFSISFNEVLSCFTIATNLSDFTLKDAAGTTVPITGVNSACQLGNPWSYQKDFTFDITWGSYVPPLYLTVKTGSDGNTIANICGTFLSPNDTLAIIDFFLTVPISLGSDITACTNSPPVLDAGYPGSTYLWLPTNETTQTIVANQTGTYIVTVSLTATCTGTDTINVTLVNPPAPALGNDIAICAGDPPPVIDCNVPGALSYQWYYNGFQIPGNTQTLQTTLPGTYSVIVSNGQNCFGYDTLELTLTNQLPVTLGSDLVVCSNEAFPLLDANVTATGYQWYLNNVLIGGATGQTYQTSQGGTYTVVATSATGCSGTDTVDVNVNQAPNASLGPDTTVCFSLGYTLDATGQGTSFQWFMNGGSLPVTSATFTPVQLGSNTYSVIVTDANNCKDTTSVIVELLSQAPAPLVSNVSYCEGQPIPSLDAGVTNVNYQWLDSDNNPIPGETNQVFTPQVPGTYTVVVSYNGICSNQATATVTQNPIPTLTPSVNSPYGIDNDHTPAGVHICDKNDLNITVTSAPAAASYVWTYFENEGVQGEILSVTGATYNVLQGDDGYGLYEIEITDQNGCINRIEIEVEEECELEFFNVVTPNNDGNNDYWEIKNFDSEITHLLTIYNRWGNVVFTTSHFDNKWQDADLPDGTYFYALTYNGKGYNGTITKLTEKKKQ